jgi:SAM-dependent methyltransferase
MKSLRRHQRDWEDLGRVDPLWAVLSAPSRRHGGWDSTEFFASGVRHVTGLMKTAERLGLPKRRETALDFGCGLGRLTRALAEHFDSCVGVDISEAMVSQARAWHRDCPSCHFEVNTSGHLQAFGDASFDFVCSRYVLQHLPSNQHVRTYLHEFLRVLRPGGLAVFQLPRRVPLLRRIQPGRRIYRLLRSLGVSEHLLLERFELSPMRMGFLAESEAIRLVAAAGGRVILVGGENDLETTYFATHD